MAIDKDNWQTVIVRKIRIAEVKRKVQKRTGTPLQKIIDFALHQLCNDKDAINKMMNWLENEA